MDELTENLQKLNLIKAKFDQNKDIGINQIYSQPGNNTKKAPVVPPKPRKNDVSTPLVPRSTNIDKICKPSYVTPLATTGAQTDESHIYANSQYEGKTPNKTLDDAIELQLKKEALEHRKKILEYNKCVYQNAIANGQKLQFYENINNQAPMSESKMIYSNIIHPPPPLDVLSGDQDEEFPFAPPSPVSSSYSELRRATDGNCYATTIMPAPINHQYRIGNVSANHHIKNNTYSNDYGIYGPSSQNSTTYESIYEPINPRPPSQMSSRSNYSLYAPYDGLCSNSSSMNRLPIITQETEVDALTDLLVQSMHQSNADPDYASYGTCCKCNGIVSESSGCTAMGKIYHIACFTCEQCQTSLRGKPFYPIDEKPFCEEDYLNTLEKCCVCLTPICERILRATGKPYHPSCFTCVVCGKSLDGIPFTVDATNKIHCIEDFHKRFAPRCSVCKLPIMPEPDKEETIRVVALDRSFHINCYKCEVSIVYDFNWTCFKTINFF
ncbi:hypothetical protein ACKWTF_006919 [Chironomus riparius]